ncbi:MAG TPA: hypothetical protein ENJ45_00715, partial [Phaeodactylibacter sp.]|nr:hypothetical protein [Phaeodactylibacter sp.]
MRLIINLILVTLIAAFVWILYNSIWEPIAFQREKDRRQDAVVAKLRHIREAQEIYRNVTGSFAPSYQQLKDTLRYGKIMIIAVEGDPDDPTQQELKYDTSFQAAIDLVKKANINLDSIEFVPFSGGKTFELFADTVIYQKTKVPVVEVKIAWKDFMGDFADPKFKKYDDTYNPDDP